MPSKEYNKQYNITHRIQIAKRKKKYYKLNREKILEDCKVRRKIYYQKNKEKIKLDVKKYRQENKNKVRECNRNYRNNNRDQVNKYYRIQYAKIENKIKQLLRTRLRDGLQHNIKSQKTLNLLGCSIKFLKVYLESQFKPGMTWENHSYKGWHIDHKRPCASFDLSKPSEQKKCFNYTNLQPLWAEENFRKNAKYPLV